MRTEVAGVPRPVAEQAHEALVDVAALAADVLPGCLGVGVSLAIESEVHTIALTSDCARLLDEAQYRQGEGPCLTALNEGQEVGCDDYVVDRRWPDIARTARSAGVSSSLSVPLRTHGGVVGALNVYAGPPHVFTDGRRNTAQLLARHGALILRQLLQRHEEAARRPVAHTAVDAVQRNLLPDLPALPGLVCAARQPAAARAGRMGGGWYDLFPLPDGAVGVAIGDIAGDDGAAATSMSQLRSVLRSIAYEGASPSLVLDRMDRVVEGFDLVDRATVFYGRLITDAGGALLLYSNAGHPPPLLTRPDGTVTPLTSAASGRIGISPREDRRPRTEAAIDLPAGATLLLHTGGLLPGLMDGPQADLRRAMHILAGTLTDIPGEAPPAAVCQTVLDRLVAPERHGHVTTLAIRISDRSRPWPPEPRRGGEGWGRPAEHARRLAHLLAEAERESRRLSAELRDDRWQELVDDDVLSRAERCRLLVQDALACGAVELPTLLHGLDDELPDPTRETR